MRHEEGQELRPLGTMNVNASRLR